MGLIEAILSTYLKTAKMDPIETRQSMLEDPSRGSKVTMYFPCLSVSTSIAVSSSSDTRRHVVYELRSRLMNNSFARTSSFFTSSPWTLV